MIHASSLNSFKLMIFSSIAIASIVFSADVSEAHVRVTPAGRMGASDATKFIQNNKANPALAPDSPGPCQNFRTRMATPLQLRGGQSFTFQVQETINHPGRFYVQFSPGGDAGFWNAANQLAVVEDLNNRATTPVTFTVPDLNCTTCTFRVLQEMDEQPNEFYVHCIDANIVSSTASVPPTPLPEGPPSGGTEGASSVTDLTPKPGFGGCGVIAAKATSDGDRGGPPGSAAFWLLLFAPMMWALFLRGLKPNAT